MCAVGGVVGVLTNAFKLWTTRNNPVVHMHVFMFTEGPMISWLQFSVGCSIQACRYSTARQSSYPG